MTFTTFKQYAHQISTVFAARLALQEGVTVAQVHLWILRTKTQSEARSLIAAI